MNTPLYEGQEVRAESPKHRDLDVGGVVYGMLAPPDPPWPGVVLIVNDEYPWGTYCGVKWIQAVD